METWHGNLGDAIWRSLIGQEGEGFFLARYSAIGGLGDVTFGNHLPDASFVRIPIVDSDNPLHFEPGAFGVMTAGIRLGAGPRNVASFGSGEGFFWLNATREKDQGPGTLYLSSLGEIRLHELREEETLVIDSGHILAIEQSVDMKLGLAAHPDKGILERLAHSVMSGEKLVVRASGPGRVYLQSRTRQQFEDWLAPMMARIKRSEQRRRASKK